MLLMFLNLSVYWKWKYLLSRLKYLCFLCCCCRFFCVLFVALFASSPLCYCYLFLLCWGSPKSLKPGGFYLGFVAALCCCFINYCKNYWCRNKKTWNLNDFYIHNTRRIRQTFGCPWKSEVGQTNCFSRTAWTLISVISRCLFLRYKLEKLFYREI